MADRQQHIDTLEWLLGRQWSDRGAAIFDSTDPRVHDALTAALHANADRARVLAAHADNGWLDEDGPRLVCGCHHEPGMTPEGCDWRIPPVWQRRYVSTWDPE